MGNSLRLFSFVLMFVLAGCSSDEGGGSAGMGGTPGTGGTSGSGGSAGTDGMAGSGGDAGTGGMGGTGGTRISEWCIDNGNCLDDDCVCPDCEGDIFSCDLDACNNNGTCTPFLEGCDCADCDDHPECLD